VLSRPHRFRLQSHRLTLHLPLSRLSHRRLMTNSLQARPSTHRSLTGLSWRQLATMSSMTAHASPMFVRA
jgi:hypothetical protein